MATKKSSSTKSSSSSTRTTSSSSSSKRNVWGLNKISMYTIVAVALLYVISMILSLVGVNFKVVSALQNLATAIMIVIVSIFQANKPPLLQHQFHLALQIPR